MSKKIIVAGAGHGGLATAMLLAKEGFDVTVYEKNSRESMGHDWTDAFDRKSFAAIGLPMPDESLYYLKHDITFYGPAERTALQQSIPEDELEINMERKDLYDYLLPFIEEAGVKFVYNCEIYGPLLEGEKVIGIKTDIGEIRGDLVIDACGANSPVRRNLPEGSGIQREIGPYEQFWAYRAFYEKAAEPKDKYKVILLSEYEKGISWVTDNKNRTDILIGKFYDFDLEKAEKIVEKLRKTNPSIGNKLVRGGQIVNIPVRQPLGILVTDGYAAIGDSAFMTTPIIGSGIANTLKASPILAESLIRNKDKDYTADVLWDYQSSFYKKMGAGLAPIACIKMMISSLSGEELDFLVDNHILTAENMAIGADSNNIMAVAKTSAFPIFCKKMIKLFSNKSVAPQFTKMVSSIGISIVISAMMPKKYNKKKALNWVKKYNNCFRPYK